MNQSAGGPTLLHAIVAVVLRYPEEDVVRRRGELADLAGTLARRPSTAALRRLLGWWTGVAPRALQEAYVETFDLHKRCSLYLTYYLYGDRRQRGQEFVRLKRLYEAAGRFLVGRELPDFLPLMLEFAALEPAPGAAILWDSRVGLELLQGALHAAASPWADALDAICLELPALDDAGRELARRLAAEGPPGEQVGLDPYGPPEAMPPSGIALR